MGSLKCFSDSKDLDYRPEIETESVTQTLNRIREQSDLWVDYNEFLQYFTRRGRPM